ncbi:MAG: hypothetical protein MI919_32010, partial [Holophagales bacterium]|nr:hypothetical protein [Holophagales bacterium]
MSAGRDALPGSGTGARCPPRIAIAALLLAGCLDPFSAAPARADGQRPGEGKIHRLPPVDDGSETHDHRARIPVSQVPPRQDRFPGSPELGSRSVAPSKNATAPCDDSGFATKTGAALVSHVRNAPTDPGTGTSCVNRLFTAAEDSVRFAAFA